MRDAPRVNGVPEPVGHPALVAWDAAYAGDHGRWVAETMECTSKTDTYLLTDEMTGLRVVAKRCLHYSFVVERVVYAELLPSVRATALGLIAELEDGDSSWLFLECAEGIPYDSSVAAHRTSLGSWLGALHGSASTLDVPADLPSHGPGRYLDHLESARRTIVENLSNPALSLADVAQLENVVTACDSYLNRWERIERVYSELPPTLVHGDIAPKNVRLLEAGAGQFDVKAFDWEMSGWGPPAADLAKPLSFNRTAASSDPAAYFEAIRPFWPSVTRGAIARAGWVGAVVRYIAALDWDATRLRFPSVERPLLNLPLHRDRIDRLLERSP